MESKAHPFTNLFETIEHEPMNYIQALQDLMTKDPSVALEVAVVPDDQKRPQFGDKYMKLDLQRITEKSLRRYKKAFYQLGKFANERDVEVLFPGLDTYKQIYTKDQCCSWFSQHKTHAATNARLEMISLLAGIESQAKPSKDRWIIEVTEGL